MSDRELLDLAAKAAGFAIAGQSDLPSIQCDLWWNAGILCWGGEEDSPWNPLTDDGDALRLAVKLGLADRVICISIGRGKSLCEFLPELHDSDAYAATRRAIVRAAAEIGRRL